ncbi:MAG: diacylglycerol kinase family lipid kinase [Fidelibacterota bacterium]|nr:MAG: diacylglycerol kinase family lipid kinase [Candidatus Neomarinimicrobiota bacterium]
MPNKTVHTIFNPTAGGGRAEKLRPRLLSGIAERFGSDYSLDVTSRQGDATASARRAIEAGAGLVITVGGDGTIHETVNGFFKDREMINPSCELGIVDCGSGSGLALSLGLPPSIEQQLDLIARQDSCTIDLGRVVTSSNAGEKVERIFASECQVGIGGAVVAEVGAMHKRLGGTLAYGIGSIKQVFRFNGQAMTVELSNNEKVARGLLGLAIGNGSCIAGGMKLTPAAELNDGLFDVLMIHDMSILTRLWNFLKIYRGTHIDTPHVSIFRSDRITIESENPVLVSADGELLGVTPCEFELIPAALKVKCRL